MAVYHAQGITVRSRHIASAALLACLGVLLRFDVAGADSPAGRLTLDPSVIHLSGGDASLRVLLTEESPAWQLDRTTEAEYRIADAKIAAVSPTGVVTPVADGQTTLTVTFGGKAVSAPVTISNAQMRPPLHFEYDIEPIVTRFGCNAAGCHGKAEGQNGFKMSAFGFDPEADYRAIVREGRGRRLFPAAPEQSLFLQKASGGRPHGGGVRIPRERPEYETLRRWIAEGAAFGPVDAAQVTSINLTPDARRMPLGGKQQLRVLATMSDGRVLDVTRLTRYQSNNEGLASVDEEGLVTAGQTPGIAAIMASYLGHVDVYQVLLPRSEPLVQQVEPPQQNFIDGLVYRRLQDLQIAPSGLCTDADFLRRAHLDLIGTLPTAAETRRFLADPRENKRAALVDELLARPEFNDFWALKLADLLRVDRLALGHSAAYAQYRWIRESLAANKPLDQFARDVLTAEGPLSESPQGYLFKAVPQPGAAASSVSQIFLGIRIECAQCHHHPYDRWSQTDYFGMAAYFAQLSRKNSSLGELLVAEGDPNTKHPRSGQTVTAHPLGEPMPEKNIAGDRRVELAAWMTSPGNPFFARNWANRLWAHMLGRGLVEPVDDFRATNPPSNPELLEALAREVVSLKFDLRAVLKTIAASRVYQHSSEPNATNIRDEQNYSRFFLKRLDAEVLLDALSQTTGVPEKFAGMPTGGRAVQLWDSQIDHYFLRVFGRPSRQSVCECERVGEPSVAQVLHLLNSDRVQSKLSRPDGLIAQLVRRLEQDSDLADELYFTIFNRPPTVAERRLAVAHLQAARSQTGAVVETARREAAEDLAWTMLNTLEFVFNH
jgi:hypothetical protein